MALEGRTFGEVTVYGDWSDTDDRQFAVVWGESGDVCTVMIMSGFDYGGGISQISGNVPLKRAEEIVYENDDIYVAKSEMSDLVKEFQEASYG